MVFVIDGFIAESATTPTLEAALNLDEYIVGKTMHRNWKGRRTGLQMRCFNCSTLMPWTGGSKLLVFISPWNVQLLMAEASEPWKGLCPWAHWPCAWPSLFAHVHVVSDGVLQVDPFSHSPSRSKGSFWWYPIMRKCAKFIDEQLYWSRVWSSRFKLTLVDKNEIYITYIPLGCTWHFYYKI